MPADGLTDEEIRSVLGEARRIALVGASNKPARPSHRVMHFLLRRGYQVVPVNPGLAGQDLLGRRAVADLAEAAASGPIDMVDVFREPSATPAIARQAVAIGAKALWLQLGVVNDEAMRIAREGGLVAVQDRCPAIEIPRLGIPPIGTSA